MTSQHIPGELLVKVDMEAHVIVSPIKSEIKFQIVGYSEDTLYKFDKDYILKYSDYVINNNFDFRLFLNTISSKINRIKLNKNSNLKFRLAIFFEEKSFFGDALRFLVYVDLIFNDTFDIVGFKNSNMIAMLHILKIKKVPYFTGIVICEVGNAWRRIKEKLNTIKPEFDKFYFGDDDFLNLSCTVFDLFFPSRSPVYRELFDDSFDRSEKSIPITKVPINTNLYQSQVEEQSPRKVVVVKKHNPEQKKNTDKYTFYENNIKKEINEYFSFRNKLQSTTGEYTFIVARSIIEHLLKLAIYLDYRFNNTDELISLSPGDKIKSESFKNCFPSNILNILGEIIRTGNKVAHESADFNYTDKDIEETKKITESLCNWFELSYPQIKETNA